MTSTRINEFDRLTRVLVRSPATAFTSDRIGRQWRALNFTAPPDPARAADEHAAFRALVASAGAEIEELADAEGLTLDSIYARDASVVTPQGLVLCRMGKRARTHEPDAHRRAFAALGIRVAGAIEAPGLLEGGDVIWFDEHTVAVGRGYRTNDAGISQLRDIVGRDVEVMVVPLPHYRGSDDVFHLMSMLSPVDDTLAVVYSPLLPVPLREWLIDRGIGLVEVPDEEFGAMGANVLAVAPRRCVMLNTAPVTRARLEAVGAEVMTYEGTEISVKGGGGPTCLTRPLRRIE
jgi:N-dimethylarginine dimethylaminohydrolase